MRLDYEKSRKKHGEKIIEHICRKFRKHIKTSFLVISQKPDEFEEFVKEVGFFDRTYFGAKIWGRMDFSDNNQPKLVLHPIYFSTRPRSWKPINYYYQVYTQTAGIGRHSLRPRRPGGSVPPIPHLLYDPG